MSIIKELLPLEKQALAMMMFEMIKADGGIDEEEMKVFIVVWDAAEFPLPDAA